jgi:hypothetical protein
MHLNSAILHQLAVHIVGNKATDEGPQLSTTLLAPEEGLREALQQFFTRPFLKTQGLERFTHPSQLQYNTCYSIVQKLFAGDIDLYDASVELAQYLFDKSGSHFIKKGEFYVAWLKDVVLEGENTDAIGLFKSESKEPFMKVLEQRKDVALALEEGVALDKLDKGALIFNTEAADGYRIVSIDKTNKQNEAQYWVTDFLGIEPAADSFHNTQNFLTLTREYITQNLKDEFVISKTDQADYLNRSVNYFKNADQFNEQEFSQEVFGHAPVMESFSKFKEQYAQERDWEIQDDFDISAAAVKKQSRIFKSVIKLDKNFHIYVHGNKELIEQGYDQKLGKKYYKIYFDEES